MNSLNLLSAKVIGSPITRTRTKSQSEAINNTRPDELLRGRSQSTDKIPQAVKQEETNAPDLSLLDSSDGPETPVSEGEGEDEKQLLLRDGKKEEGGYRSRLYTIVKKIADALTAILATIGIPVIYVARRFQDESGHFSALAPFKRKRRKSEKSTKKANEDTSEKPYNRVLSETKLKHSYSSDSLSSMNSDSDSDRKRAKEKAKKQHLEPEVPSHRRRSSRIRLLQNDDVTQRRKSRLADSNATSDTSPMTVENIKSPISASTANKLKYPHAPQPPRPLIPRRQPSYSNLAQLSSPPGRRHNNQPLQQKTLILDLDETLIHSIAKGSRMSSGHMVEVKLNTHVLNPVAQVVPGQPAPPPQIVPPQHPILYYVHKRPHCDDFLRKVCKWYKVVIFTASVQEYADPVVDWLEQEKKYFAGRYYRQHCTFRNGAYIKDLSSIEPDLSKVIILDNSPVSYVFHEGEPLQPVPDLGR